MTGKRAALALLAALVAAGCSAPSVTYEDPLAQIGRSAGSAADAQFKTMTLGVVFTDNTKKAMGVVAGEQQEIGSFGALTNQTALADADPVFLTKSIDETLRRRFKDVLVLQGADERKKAAADAVMFLDVQVKVASLSGQATTVALQGIFVDDAQAVLGQVKGDGSGVIPYPATTTGFKAAASQAVQRFAEALDGAGELAGRLAAPPSAPPPALLPLPPEPELAAAPAGGRRVALVVGNAKYQNVPRLSNTVADARLVAEALKKDGFELVGGGALVDLDHTTFIKVLTIFGNRLAGSLVGVFYYAGHGLQVQGANYLVPVEANPTRISDAETQLIDAALVLQEMDDSHARLKVVILDACRNNPFGGRGLRDAGGGLAQMRAPEGTLISYATQPGNVAGDGDPGGDSPFTVALARSIATPGLDVLSMFNEVGVQVDTATKGAQQPWISSSPIKGKFYFAGQ